MRIWGLSKLYGRMLNKLTAHLDLTAPPEPPYEEASEEEVRKLWDQKPEKQVEALQGLEAAFGYRDRSGSNSLVMKGLIFTGFFALIAIQLTVGLTTVTTPFLIAAPVYMVAALYTLAGARCIGEAFRPTPGQLNPKHLKDERIVKLLDGLLAQYLEVGGREKAQRSLLRYQRVWLYRSLKHLERSLKLTAIGIVIQTIIMLVMMIVHVVQFFIWLF